LDGLHPLIDRRYPHLDKGLLRLRLRRLDLDHFGFEAQGDLRCSSVSNSPLDAPAACLSSVADDHWPARRATIGAAFAMA
jgi:hypothetical protein